MSHPNAKLRIHAKTLLRLNSLEKRNFGIETDERPGICVPLWIQNQKKHSSSNNQQRDKNQPGEQVSKKDERDFRGREGSLGPEE